ncbi:hypothetical protein L218DRAFT_1072359 [Marasmius fiardii PR-910]|nr:hypothetical protein L218DRAFT_1072359 [Marasmius fiardii PR-910]
MTLRRLDLHVSALNDAEYNLYTSSLADITLTDEQYLKGHDDTYYEQLSLSLREARAWLKGRYSHLPSTVIDNILRLFSPNLSQTESLSGGQFFAALRLVVHAESGKEVDRALAFVQAHPTDRPITRPSSPSKPSLLSMPSRRSIDIVHTTPSSADNTSSVPFTPPPQHPSATNPFTLGRAKSNPGVPPSVKYHVNPLSDTTPSNNKLPPLPPRKPSSAVVPPPRHGSLTSTSPSLAISSPVTSKTVPAASGSHPPVVPPKPTHFAHVTSTLMKQSLQASKTGQTMKKAEEQLERERVLQVLKSSASSPFSNALSSRARSVSPNKPGGLSTSSSSNSTPEIDRGDNSSRAPPLPKRRGASASGSVSSSSFHQVALATTPSQSGSSTNPFVRNPFSSLDPKVQSSPSPILPPTSTSLPSTPSLPPPKHPDQNYRKPPPPIPSSLLNVDETDIEDIDSTSFDSKQGHRRSPSNLPRRAPYSAQEKDFVSEPLDTYSRSTAKSAGPYTSVFGSDATPTTTTMKNEESPTARLFRSKSMHHPSSPVSPSSPANESSGHRPLPPPVRKRRPESVQVLPGQSQSGLYTSPASGSFKQSTVFNPKDSPRTDAHRGEPSFHHDVSRTHDPLNLKSIAASLSPQLHQLQPKLDKARFKAEAGLSKRGFIVNPSMSRRKEDQEGLMSGEDRSSEVDDDGDLRNPYVQRRGNRERPKTVSGSGVSVWEDNIVYSDSSDECPEDAGRNRHRGVKQSRITNNNSPIRERRVGSAPSGSDQDDLRADMDHLKWPVGESEGWRRL